MNTLLRFIAANWFWIIIFWGFIASFVEGVRDFFLDVISYIMKVRHRHRMAEIKAQAKAAQQAAAAAELEPGPCRHRHITPVVVDDNVVAWLCKNEDCLKQLPKDFAIRQQDVPQPEEK